MVPCVLFVMALAIRSYRLAASPLWFDEIYGYQLARLGVGAILRNSLVDEHPPLYNLIQWVASGFGTLHTEWAWRWPSLVSGSATIPLIYHLARRSTNMQSAGLSALVVVFSPAHIYFSQEARPYAFTMLVAVLTILLVFQIQRHPTRRSLWLTYTGLCLLGLWSQYSFILVVGVQIVYLAFVLRLVRGALLHTAAVALLCLPLIGLSNKTLSGVAADYRSSEALTIRHMAQSLLAGEPLRYGLFWGHIWVPMLLGICALLGVGSGTRPQARRETLYHGMQVVLPLIGFFVVAVPLLGIRLPVFESKQFMAVLPSSLVLIALGIYHLQHYLPSWVGRVIVLSILGIVIYASLVSLQRYWTTSKSPEGAAVLALRDQVQPGDAVVSLHYSVDAALSFYLPEVLPYTKPQQSEDGYLFSRSVSVLPAEQASLARTEMLASVRRHPRIWLFAVASMDNPLRSAITQGCKRVHRQVFSPFELLRLEQCL